MSYFRLFKQFAGIAPKVPFLSAHPQMGHCRWRTVQLEGLNLGQANYLARALGFISNLRDNV